MPAAITFFAVRDDLIALLEFLVTRTEARLFEAYSRFDEPLRTFDSALAVDAAYPLGVDEHGNGASPFLQLWWPAVCPAPRMERIELRPSPGEEHTFRHVARGWGLAQLQCGGCHGEIITKSHFGHFTEAGARRQGYLEAGPEAPVNWVALQAISRRVQRHIRATLAAGRVRGRGPVLPAAAALVRAGAKLKESARSPWDYDAELDGTA